MLLVESILRDGFAGFGDLTGEHPRGTDGYRIDRMSSFKQCADTTYDTEGRASGATIKIRNPDFPVGSKVLFISCSGDTASMVGLSFLSVPS